MRIGIVAYGSETPVTDCPGPQPGGACPLLDRQTRRLPCAGKVLMLRLPVVGKPSTWLFKVATDAEECPVHLLRQIRVDSQTA